jgi:hypothetical protein
MSQVRGEMAQRIVEDWVSFWNTYDLDLVDRLFLCDDRVTYLSSERQGLIKGIEAVRKHHEGFGFVRGGKTTGNRLWLENLDAEEFGPATVVTGIWFFRRQNATADQKGPVTLVYVQGADRPRIAHANFGNYA